MQWKCRANSVFRASASCSKILNYRKYVFNTVKISGRLCSLSQVQVAQTPWMIKNVCSIQWKFSGKPCFSGQAQVAQKSWMIKNISIQWKYSGQTLFFRAISSCSKILSSKEIYSIQWKYSGQTLFFWASASCSNILNVKAYSIQWKISGNLCFSGQAQVAQKSWMIKSIQGVSQLLKQSGSF